MDSCTDISKNMVLNLFGPQSLKEKLLPQVEDAAIRSLSCWSGQESVDAREAIATVRPANLEGNNILLMMNLMN